MFNVHAFSLSTCYQVSFHKLCSCFNGSNERFYRGCQIIRDYEGIEDLDDIRKYMDHRQSNVLIVLYPTHLKSATTKKADLELPMHYITFWLTDSEIMHIYDPVVKQLMGPFDVTKRYGRELGSYMGLIFGRTARDRYVLL